MDYHQNEDPGCLQLHFYGLLLLGFGRNSSTEKHLIHALTHFRFEKCFFMPKLGEYWVLRLAIVPDEVHPGRLAYNR